MKEKYQIILSDPPWAHNNQKTGGSMKSGAASQYSVMSIGDICALNVRGIAEKDAFLFMWWVASMPREALRVVSSWGFQITTMTAFSWIKQTRNQKGEIKDHFGMGFHSRQQQEHCLIAKRGKPVVVSHSVRQNVRALVRGHSQKPGEVRDKIVELCGDVPRLEMFARGERVRGWDAWGNEVEDPIEIPRVKVSSLRKKLRT